MTTVLNTPLFNAYSDIGANQLGGDLPYFIGKQYGSGWLGTLARIAFPILKRVAGVASGAAQDVLYKNKPIRSSIQKHAMKEISNVVGNLTNPSTINRRAKKRKHSSQKTKNDYPLFSSQRRQRRK